ncbi:MAG: sugar ABC transporter ATP-binding protein [Synergistaceae bacterium]|jgi:ribose transport system ATP-binding protein/inositol transport system ATP-binding protein|nr:sugar ABC transporter ATP-binding protein [Synergistaceae bacterium]
METIVEMRRITKRFGDVMVLDDVHFDLRRGEVHALIGENGAGKSTMIKILAGVHGADKGEVFVAGAPVRFENVRDSMNMGISVIYQELSLAPTMTVAENIYLGQMPRTSFGLIDDEKMIREAYSLLKRFGLDNISPVAKASSLSVAQQQMIEVLRALSRDCRILIMDEPTASLTDKEISKLFGFIKDLQDQGVAIVYISHRMDEIFQISDRITVLRDGRYIGTKITSETDYEELVSMMVGREFKNIYSTVKGSPGDEILKVVGLNRGTQVRNVTFSVRRGEVLGFYGLMGSGRTETMRIIFGVDEAESGDIYLEGNRMSENSVRNVIKKGIVLAPEDRKEQGLVLIQGIRYNISLSIMDQIIHGFRVDREREDRIAGEYVKMLNIRARSGYEQPVNTLSGGNQQKVVISKCLAATPKVVILDEPTRGVDIGAKHELYRLITELADSGTAVVFVSSELPEIINLCTRVIVMHEGRVTGELSKSELTERGVLKLALGGKLSATK